VLKYEESFGIINYCRKCFNIINSANVLLNYSGFDNNNRTFLYHMSPVLYFYSRRNIVRISKETQNDSVCRPNPDNDEVKYTDLQIGNIAASDYSQLELQTPCNSEYELNKSQTHYMNTTIE